MLAVQRLDFVHRLSEPEQRGDDGAGGSPVDEVELLAEEAADEALDLFQGPEPCKIPSPPRHQG